MPSSQTPGRALPLSRWTSKEATAYVAALVETLLATSRSGGPVADYLSLRAALAQADDDVVLHVEPQAIMDAGGTVLNDPSRYDGLTREELVSRLNWALNQLWVADEKLRIVRLLADVRDEHGAKIAPAPTPTALRDMVRAAASRWKPRYPWHEVPAEPLAVPAAVRPGQEPAPRRKRTRRKVDDRWPRAAYLSGPPPSGPQPCQAHGIVEDHEECPFG